MTTLDLTSHGGQMTLARRSSLILPVNQPRFVERAYTRGADAIVLDLEDSVPVAEKANARKLVKEIQISAQNLVRRMASVSA